MKSANPKLVANKLGNKFCFAKNLSKTKPIYIIFKIFYKINKKLKKIYIYAYN